jgi:transposase
VLAYTHEAPYASINENIGCLLDMIDAKHKSSYIMRMNKLPLAKRAQILELLCEGMSMRSIERIVGCSINTIDKLLQDAGEAALEYHDKHVRGVKAQRVQCDEIWSFVGAKQKNVPASSRAGDPTAGDCWTWTAIDADSKLLVSYLVGGRDLNTP